MPANLTGGTTNFPNGVTNVGTLATGAGSTLQSYVAPDPSRVHQWFNDFDGYVAADWTVTSTGGGTAAVQNADGGILLLTNGSSDNDNTFLQYKGGTSSSTVETFSWDATRAMWFHARLKVSSATQSDFVIGLQITDTSPLAVSDGFYFQKDDDSTSLYFSATSSSTSTSVTGLATIADDTYFSVGFWWDPSLGVLNLYYNGNPVGSISNTANFTAHTLTLSFGIQNGDGNSRTMSLDFLHAAKDRLAFIA